MTSIMTNKVIFAVDEDDEKYVISTMEEIMEAMGEDAMNSVVFRKLLNERWIPARDRFNDLVWLNIERLKRLEFKEVRTAKT